MILNYDNNYTRIILLLPLLVNLLFLLSPLSSSSSSSILHFFPLPPLPSPDRDKSAVPSMTLTTAIQREMNPRAPVPIPLGSKEDQLRSAVAKEKKSTAISSWAPQTSAR